MLIDGKSFFDLPVKNEEAYEKIIEMSRSNDNASGNLLDFTHFKENYRLNAIDLSQQSKLKDPQQIKLSGKLEEQNNGATIFSSLKNQKKLLLKFYKTLWTSYKNRRFQICQAVLKTNFQNLQQENGTLLIVNQMLVIQITIQQKFLTK